MGETWQGLITDFTANLLRFSSPTHTHNFDNHSDGYGHLKTALVRNLAGSRKSVSSMGLNIETVQKYGEVYHF
jgi:hypothetical protein